MKNSRFVGAVCAVASMLILGVPTMADGHSPQEADNARYFRSQDVFGLEVASDPQVSPDGEQVVYVRRSNDIMTDRTRSNIWIADAEGSSHRPLLSGKRNFTSPRWSPTGSRIAYVSNTEGGTPQIYVRWMDTGQIALLTNIQASASNLSWSPNGRFIAFTMSVPSDEKPFSVKLPKKPKGAKWSPDFKYITKARYQADGRGILDPAYTHIFIVPADGGIARQLTSGNYHHRGSLSWAADGSKIYFSANRNDTWEYESRDADIFTVDLAGTIKQVTNEPGTETSPTVSPNGRHLAYIKYDNEKLAYRNRYLHVLDINGDGSASNDRNLSTEIDNAIATPVWDGNRALYYQQTVRGVTEVGHVTLGGRHRQVAGGLGGVSLGRPYASGTYDAAGGTVAFTRGSHDRPADIHVLQGRSERQLTELNEDLLGHKVLGDVHEIVYTSSIDGEEIQGWYITPPDFDPGRTYPLILEIHGGPHLSYGPHFSAEIQRMAAEGYVVFYDNHRGSSGYGERFALLLQGKYSSEYDFADHMSGIDAVIEKGFVDPDRLYITGGSAGGIASAYAIGLTNRFKAAAVAKPVINWLSKVLTADSGLSQIPNQFPGMPWEHLEHYWQRSPLSLVGNVTTPTLLITGEEDRRTPISETEQFYQALKLRKIDTVMVRVPGSPHGIAGRPSRLIGKVENILAWFKKYE